VNRRFIDDGRSEVTMTANVTCFDLAGFSRRCADWPVMLVKAFLVASTIRKNADCGS